jgi:hypothetical protein
MGLGAMIYEYILSFIKIGSAIQKLIRGYTDTQKSWRPHKPTFIIFLNKENRLINKIVKLYRMQLGRKLDRGIYK